MSIDTRPIPWDQLTEPVEIAHALVGLYRQRGDARYGETVTHTEHAVQCGAYAMAAGATDAGVLAAFFHDIGHLLEPASAAGGGARSGAHAGPVPMNRAHEHVGAEFLARFFGPDVTVPVRLHVAAKRYLCTVDPAYVRSLSAASVRSLALQGGPMSDDELATFETTPGAMGAVDLRRWDGLATVAGAPAPGLDVFTSIVVDVLGSTSHR